jgi:hypothetical protein
LGYTIKTVSKSTTRTKRNRSRSEAPPPTTPTTPTTLRTLYSPTTSLFATVQNSFSLNSRNNKKNKNNNNLDNITIKDGLQLIVRANSNSSNDEASDVSDFFFATTVQRHDHQRVTDTTTTTGTKTTLTNGDVGSSIINGDSETKTNTINGGSIPSNNHRQQQTKLSNQFRSSSSSSSNHDDQTVVEVLTVKRVEFPPQDLPQNNATTTKPENEFDIMYDDEYDGEKTTVVDDGNHHTKVKQSIISRVFSPVKRLFNKMTTRRKGKFWNANTTNTTAAAGAATIVTATKSFSDGGVSVDETHVPKSHTGRKRRSLRRLWRRRHARTLEEGIRRERTDELSMLMNRAQIDANQGQERSYVERTLMGLINVLAEEIEDLDIDLNTIPNTPLWRKEVEELRINFSRLGFRPIRMGGTNAVIDRNIEEAELENVDETENLKQEIATELSFVESADEGFNKIDEDNSGTLDRDELAQALSSISALEADRNSIEELASELVTLYDVNGDGVVDRQEYQQMVEDMAKLRSASLGAKRNETNPFAAVKDSIQSVKQEISKKAAEVASVARETLLHEHNPKESFEENEMGSIVLSNLNLDLRRLVFGGLPIVKKITPGGPLILEPFTATVTASFSREDVLGSFLLDAGLRRLVARALRVRVRSFRDIVDGALFVGRRWKMTSKSAPVVEVLGLSNIEFDSRDRMIITGRARVRTSPDAPVVTNTFKVRAKIGTRKNGHVIRLVEPELAFVFECPEALEKGLQIAFETFGLPPPKRPEPYYSFFPIYSPFKVDDNDGFDMGEDNCIRSIFIRDGKLRFEMSAVLRPGRFLGNHYVAFTLPMRTFIITMDRVWEGVRAARENKRVAAREKRLKEKEVAQNYSTAGIAPLNATAVTSLSSLSSTTSSLTTAATRQQGRFKPKSFFARFVEGYTMTEREGEANNERLASDISDWFGRQGNTNGTSTPANSKNLTATKVM